MFSYLDYSFDVLISRIDNLDLHNWFYLLLYAYAHDMVFNTCSWIQLYQYTCAYLCTPLGIHHTTRWGVLTLLDLHVQILKLEPW